MSTYRSRSVSLLLAALLFSGGSQAAAGEFHPCDPSPVEVFQNVDPNAIERLVIQADFETINGSPDKETARSAGTIEIAGSRIAANVEARGNSRFDSCGFRPLTLRFSEDPVGTVLQGVGKKLKVVTHCGYKDGDQWILGGTPEEQRQRVLAEHYVYAMLQQLDTTVLDTRLLDISYLDPSGREIERALGFFREPVKRMAERCGLKKAKDEDPLMSNADSAFTAELISNFITSNDWGFGGRDGEPWWGHNISILKSKEGQVHLAPYDFDLIAVIRPEYIKNMRRGANLIDHSVDFNEWLSRATTGPKKAAVESLTSKLADMKEIIDASLLSESMRSRFDSWHQIYSRTLELKSSDDD